MEGLEHIVKEPPFFAGMARRGVVALLVRARRVAAADANVAR
jgi:hypothetical protein